MLLRVFKTENPYCADLYYKGPNIDKIFIDALNKKIDELRLKKNKTSASDSLVGQIKKGEQLIK